MITHIKTETLPLTQQLAQEFSSMAAMRGERELRADRLEFLRAKIKDGLFHSPRWAFANIDGRKVRVNGQHSSKLLADLNGAMPTGLNVVIDEFTCDTEEDLCELFAQFDPVESTRRAKDIVNAHARIHPDLDDMTTARCNLIISGIAMHMLRGVEWKRKKVTGVDRARLIHNGIPFFKWIAPRLDLKRLRKVPVIAAMFATWAKDCESADRFWDAVAREDEHPTHPTRTLSTFLSEAAFGRLKGKGWTARAVYSKCLIAWNAWRKGNQTMFRYNQKQIVEAV